MPHAVLVIWDDAFDGPGGWISPDSYAMHTVRPKTVGWIIDNSDMEYLTVYSSYYLEEDGAIMCSNPMHIPRGMIKSVTILNSESSGE